MNLYIFCGIISLQKNKNKNHTMLKNIERRSYNYYRTAQTKKLAHRAKHERIMRLQGWD